MDETDELEHQQMAIELCDGFTPHDVLALGELNPDELVAQYEARLALHEYVDNVWEQAKLAGLDPCE